MYSDSIIFKVLQNYFQVEEIDPDAPNITVCDIKTGLIHNSYRFSSPKGDWLVQRINTAVFKDVDGLMSNIHLVTNQLSVQFEGSPYETLSLKKTLHGDSYVMVDNAAWRIYDFKKHLKGYAGPLDSAMVYESGKAFARFSEALIGLHPDELSVTIPKFHSLRHRYEHLQQAKLNPKVSISGLDSLFDQVDLHFHRLIVLEEAKDSGNIPIRITHNDAKFNNLLFDLNHRARCVVDLDTVMPGIIHFDIGDCLRTLVPNIPEDSPDLDSLQLNFSYENDFLSGYLEVASPWITDTERELLSLSGPYMALIMGIRFLTDYLNGNVYFSCEYPTQNLFRARNQITLVGEWGVGSR
jgi:hypothetical protein